MHVEAAKARRCQDRGGQNQAIGGDDGSVGAQLGESRTLLAQSSRMAYRETALLRQQLNRRGLQTTTASRRPRRLSIDGKDMVSGSNQLLQDRRGKAGRSHEDEAEGPARSGISHRRDPSKLASGSREGFAAF